MERRLKSHLPGGQFHHVTPARSKNMAAVKSHGNKTTEVKLRMALVRAGVAGWAVQPKGLPGNPDFFFPAPNLAVFVDGCFWHGCRRCGHIPKTNQAFWQAKIDRNRARHRKVNRLLKSEGIATLRLWEHELKRDLHGCVVRILEAQPD